MADLSNVHHIVIGYDKIEEYNININILRNVFVKGKDLLITAIYNGGHPGLAAHVDNFIALKENKGYVWGAIDAIEKGLIFVNGLVDKREIVLLTNFDGIFFSEERYNQLIDDFIKSGRPFGAGYSPASDRGQGHSEHLFSDLMLFRREFVSSFYEGMDKVVPQRVDWECEKHMQDTLNVIGDVDKLWWQFERDDEEQQGRRYIFHKEYGFGHCHKKHNIENKLNEYDTLDLYLLKNKILTNNTGVQLLAIGYI